MWRGLRLAGRVEEVYLHIDMDALDPEVAPGGVDQLVSGGLSLEQLDEALNAVADASASRPCSGEAQPRSRPR